MVNDNLTFASNIYAFKQPNFIIFGTRGHLPRYYGQMKHGVWMATARLKYFKNDINLINS